MDIDINKAVRTVKLKLTSLTKVSAVLLVQTRVVDVHKKQLVLDEILKDLDRIANDSLPQVIFSLTFS